MFCPEEIRVATAAPQPRVKGSSNRTTAWLKLAKAHAAVNDQRSMSAMRRLRH